MLTMRFIPGSKPFTYPNRIVQGCRPSPGNDGNSLGLPVAEGVDHFRIVVIYKL